jgi:hypothetical protein
MNALFFDFAKQNQKKGHSFKYSLAASAARDLLRQVRMEDFRREGRSPARLL